MVKNKYYKKKPLALLKFRQKLRKISIFGATFVVLLSLIISFLYIKNDKYLAQEFFGTTITPNKESESKNLNVNIESTIAQKPIPTSTPTPVVEPTLTPTPTTIPPTIKPTSTPTPTSSKKYSAEKVGETTYKITHTSSDNSMASAQEIFNALNSYRGSEGKSNLSWDNNLSLLAQDRANTFASNNGLDSHAGFRSYMDNDGFSKAGFNSLGENSAQLAGNMNGDRIIREIFGADADHDNNQLDPSWTHVGIAVNGIYINVNFGKGKR